MKSFALVALGLAATSRLMAQDAVTNAPAKSFWERDTLTGDWGGLRSRWSDKGFDVGLEYTGEVLANTGGGVRRGELYQGLAKATLDISPEKFTGWRGAHFHASGLWIEGSEPNSRNDIAGMTGSAFSDPSNISAYDTIRLYELWLEQSFWGGKFSARAGQLALDDEFICDDYAGVFLNSAHGWSPFVAMSIPDGGQVFPVTGTGVRLAFNPTETLSFQAALADGDVHNQATDNRHGTHFGFHGNEGLLGIFEVAFRSHQKRGDTGLPGCYKLGAWYHSGNFKDMSRDNLGRNLEDDGALSGFPSTGTPATHAGNGGLYFDACQMLWRKKPGADQGLGLYARVAPWLPGDRNPLDFYAAAGLNFKGLLPVREQDVFGLGISYARVSSSLGDAQNAANRVIAGGGTPNHLSAGPVPDYEMALEATYQINLSPWWLVQPDFQYIFHPGGSAAIQDAVVIGLRTKIVF